MCKVTNKIEKKIFTLFFSDALEDERKFFLHLKDVIGRAKNNTSITCLSIDGEKIEGNAPISGALNNFFFAGRGTIDRSRSKKFLCKAP